jgi:hypothetical protein
MWYFFSSMLNPQAAITFLELIKVLPARRRIIRRYALTPSAHPNRVEDTRAAAVHETVEDTQAPAVRATPRPTRPAAVDALEVHSVFLAKENANAYFAFQRIKAIQHYQRRMARLMLSPQPSASASSASAADDADHSSDDDEDRYNALEGRWKVETILSERAMRGFKEYLIKWVGFEEPTWEPAEHADDCEEVIKNFEADFDPGFASD